MNARSIFAVALFVAAPCACARYEWIPDYETPWCIANGGRPTTQILLDSSATVVPDDIVTIRVLAAESLQPLHGALVRVTGPMRDSSWLDGSGQFRSVSLAPGRYGFVVRRIGYDIPRDSFAIPRSGGTRLLALMAPQVMDGPCSGFAAVRVRKPWWKLW